LGIEVIDDSQIGLYYGHRGTFGNTSSIVCYFPQHEITICTCHTFDGTARRLQTDALMRVIMKDMLGIKQPDQNTVEEDVLKYSALDFRIKEIQKIEKYSLNGKTFIAKNKNEKLFLIQLESKSPQKGELQYSPSKVSLQYKVDSITKTAECLAAGQILNTKSGKRGFWITREEENHKTIRMSQGGVNINLFIVFELPNRSTDIEVLFH